MICAILSLLLSASLPDSIPTVYAADGGDFLVRIEPAHMQRGKTNATARFFTFKKSSYSERSAFQLNTAGVPVDVLITTDGSRIVIVSDEFDNEHRRPVLTVYSAKGTILKSFSVRDLVPGDQLGKLSPAHPGSDTTYWAANVTLNESNQVVIVQNADGKRRDCVLDLKQFKIEPSPVP